MSPTEAPNYCLNADSRLRTGGETRERFTVSLGPGISIQGDQGGQGLKGKAQESRERRETRQFGVPCRSPQGDRPNISPCGPVRKPREVRDATTRNQQFP